MSINQLYRTIATRYGKTKFFVNDTGALSQSLMLYGEWAQNELIFMKALIPAGSTVLDVGAYIGTHTLAFAQFTGPNGNVVSIEPQNQSFALLEENVSVNGLKNVRMEHAAAADYVGILYGTPIEITEKVSFGSAALSRAAVSERGLVAHDQERENLISVDVLTIDSLKLASCALIKIDVESLEDLVICGAKKTIKRLSPVIYAECNSVASGIKTFEVLRQLGYMVRLHVVDAFNVDNFRGNTNNIFGTAKEVALVGVMGSQSSCIDEIQPRKCELILKIESADDLVLGMLNKPQYVGEILGKGAAARSGGDVWIRETRLLLDARDHANQVAHLSRLEAEAARAAKEVADRELKAVTQEVEAARAAKEVADRELKVVTQEVEAARAAMEIADRECARMQLDADASLAHMEAAMLQARFAREEADQAVARLEDLSRRYDEIQISLIQAQDDLDRYRQEVAIVTPEKPPEFTQGE